MWLVKYYESSFSLLFFLRFGKFNLKNLLFLQVGDLMRSMTLLAYKSMEGSLEEVRFLFTFTSVWDILGPLRAVFGDPWKSLCYVRNSSEDSELRLAVFHSLC